MDWDNLRIFLAIARTGSLSGAAKRLKVRPSTVSRRLKAFEDELGIRLLDRKRDGCELTPAGLELEAITRGLEQDILDIDATINGADHLEGPLRVSTADAMAVTFLMPMFTGFSKQHPEIRLHVSVSNDYVRLREREADIAIRASNSPLKTLIGQRVARLAFAVYGRQDLVERLRKNKETPQWITADGGMPNQAWIQANATQPGTAGCLVVDEAVLTQAALHQGGGVALMPCFQGDTDPQLLRWEDPVPDTALDLWLVFHKDLRRTPRLRAFRDYMAAGIREQLDLLEGRRPRAGLAVDSREPVGRSDFRQAPLPSSSPTS